MNRETKIDKTGQSFKRDDNQDGKGLTNLKQDIGVELRGKPDDRGVKDKQRANDEWLQDTTEYKETFEDQVKLSSLYQTLSCRCLLKKRDKSVSEQLLTKGSQRVERNLDIRSLIKSQEILKTFILTVEPNKERRKMMRLQRRSVVLEPGQEDTDSEDDLKRYKKMFKHFKASY